MAAMASITDIILADSSSPRQMEGSQAMSAPAPTWRKACTADIDTAAPVRWLSDDGSWRYPTGIQADNLLHFDANRCEVLVS
jgi:hypothetical protein